MQAAVFVFDILKEQYSTKYKRHSNIRHVTVCYIVHIPPVHYTLQHSEKKVMMGSLLNEINEIVTNRGNRSRISEILEKLSKEDAKDLRTALDDHSISASQISKALQKRNLKLAVNVITRYRRGELSTKI